ncbi:MAG: type II toxin-antitoxin system VapC family toxin [Bacteroidia bacterium]
MNGNNLLVDTNVFIHFFEGNRKALKIMRGNNIFFTTITEIELLGFAGLSVGEKSIMRDFLSDCNRVELTEEIREQTILLRESLRIKIPDAIVAASALHLHFPLVSADTDFRKISDLTLITLD